MHPIIGTAVVLKTRMLHGIKATITEVDASEELYVYTVKVTQGIERAPVYVPGCEVDVYRYEFEVETTDETK